jgi:uncharacterized protein (DUF608 family)
MADPRDAKQTSELDCSQSDCTPGSGCCAPVSRRTFVKLAGLGTSAAALPVMAGPFNEADTSDHFVPADKKLQTAWLKALSDPQATDLPYRGEDLATVAMPVGGICAGQMYLTGDGQLAHWDIYNELIFTGYGRDNYRMDRSPNYPLDQGFAIQVKSGGKNIRRRLDAIGFDPLGIEFSGRYPIGRVSYSEPDQFAVTLEAFSPFIPLNAPDSALPATLMQYIVTNTSSAPIEVKLAGWMENGVCLKSGEAYDGLLRNQVVRDGRLATVLSSAEPARKDVEPRKAIVLTDFEGEDYGDWTVEGEAFGTGPARGTLPSQQEVSGFQGEGLVNTFLGKDAPHGRLTSPEFTIERRFINFLIGGGNHKGKTCINLLVDGRVVRTAEGKNNEKLVWQHWAVRDLQGKQARIEIVDAESGGWGHINIDQIEQTDKPRSGAGGVLEDQIDFGTMALALLDGDEAYATARLPDDAPDKAVFRDPPESTQDEEPLAERQVGAVASSFGLAPSEKKTVTFAVAWHFPNRPQRGNYYATRFDNAEDVVRYLAKNQDRLVGQTKLWFDACYDSTLPAWLLNRLYSTASTLATSTCQWWANGRFWAWEGVGCCRGTCTHVWNYEHSMARLFPELERSVREMQDFNPEAGFVEDSGMIQFRGEGWSSWAGDGQAGTVLKAYREHLVSTDDTFLKRNWPRIRKTLEFLINEDGNQDGLLEGSQHNTYDINFFGPNTMVGSLYLAALRAAEEMALDLGDKDYASKCRRIFESGKKLTVERLFNGDYFIQDVDLEKHSKHQYGQGCLADQLFGQGWAHQVGLGYVYPQGTILKTLESIWKYNWAPDIKVQNDVHRPERWFVDPGEAGLFTCTWPKTPHLPEGVRYKNEVWTGIEYQAAGNMAYDGLVTEALAICRAIHDRYHPAKRNPFNEIECGDHYARGMASHGVFLGLCGFEYHGPKGHLGFAPKLGADDFRAVFTAAEGWGTLSQNRAGSTQTNTIDVKWGQLRIKSLALELPKGKSASAVTATLGDRKLDTTAEQDGKRVLITLANETTVQKGNSIEILTQM